MKGERFNAAPAARPAPLRRDEGGAVALLGVFFALGLTGSLWFLIGIGDAIAFREQVQEAVDASTFSSAVVHARSMNFIAAINLIMVGLTTVYLILAIIADLLQTALTTCNATVACAVGTYGAVPAALEAAYEVAHESAENYKEEVLRVGIQTGDKLQVIVARGAPWAASFAATRVGRKYDKSFKSTTLGLANAPDIGGMGLGSSGDDERLGLPVKAVKAKTLCDRVFANVKLGKHVKENSGQDFAQGFDALEQAVSKQAESAGSARYCSGDFWEEDGPKIVIKGAQNGSDYMQVYGFLLGGKLKDVNKAEKAVGALAATKRRVSIKAPRTNVYLSQAEYFFDCTGKWDDSDCNEDDGAMYMPAWKVRLRRMRSPVAGAALAGQAMSLLTTGAASVAGQALGIPDLDETLGSVGEMTGGAVGSAVSDQIQSFFTAPAFSGVSGKVKDKLAAAAEKKAKAAVVDELKKLPLPGYLH